MQKIAVGVGILVVWLFYFKIDPSTFPLPPCPFFQLTHLYCPGCGSQRGIHALVHGDFIRAIGYNPLMVLSLVYFAVELALSVVRIWSPNVRPLGKFRYTPMIVLVLVLLFWVLRNIPFSPFHLLAPG